jgi:hypothetical protein
MVLTEVILQQNQIIRNGLMYQLEDITKQRCIHGQIIRSTNPGNIIRVLVDINGMELLIALLPIYIAVVEMFLFIDNLFSDTPLDVIISRGVSAHNVKDK